MLLIMDWSLILTISQYKYSVDGFILTKYKNKDDQMTSVTKNGGFIENSVYWRSSIWFWGNGNRY